MKLYNLDHVGIAVNDLEAAIAGYLDRYGVEPIHRQVERLLGLMEAHGAAPRGGAAGGMRGGMPGGMDAMPAAGETLPGPSRRPLGLRDAGRQ